MQNLNRFFEGSKVTGNGNSVVIDINIVFTYAVKDQIINKRKKREQNLK